MKVFTIFISLLSLEICLPNWSSQLILTPKGALKVPAVSEIIPTVYWRWQKELPHKETPTVHFCGWVPLLGSRSKPVLQLTHAAVYLANVEVGVTGEVLADWGVGITESTVQGSASHTDHHGHQAEKEEKQAGIPTAKICREKETSCYTENGMSIYLEYAIRSAPEQNTS